MGIIMFAEALLALTGVASVNPASAKAVVLGRTMVEQGSPGGAPACTACHGAGLQGNLAAKVPAIAGRPADFIFARLVHYASPEGHNASMRQVAAALSPGERRAVANYVSKLPRN
jgi:cytochrome c553